MLRLAFRRGVVLAEDRRAVPQLELPAVRVHHEELAHEGLIRHRTGLRQGGAVGHRLTPELLLVVEAVLVALQDLEVPLGSLPFNAF